MWIILHPPDSEYTFFIVIASVVQKLLTRETRISNTKLISPRYHINTTYECSAFQKGGCFQPCLKQYYVFYLHISLKGKSFRHIKKLIKQHDHYTGAPCVGDNKSPLKCAVLSHNNATDISSFEGVCT